ncbi:MAG: hypothetical protein ACKV2T_06230 [Kofleriaceae bacterium]
MPVVIARAVLFLAIAASIAVAEPRRVLVVDGDTELVQAIETSLAPWKIEVIAQRNGVDPSLVATRAIQADAQFIVWRDGSELVVYDRDRDVTERRPAASGSMDPVAAAGAALTVKTMMRLPDPDASTASTTPAVTTVAPAVSQEHDALRITVGFGIDTEVAPSGTLGVRYRPMAQLRIGGTFEVAGQDLERSGFKGSARDYSFLATASWPVPVGVLELEPWIAAGVIVDIVDGRHAQVMRHETAIVPTARVGAALWWWHASQLGVAVTGSATFSVGTPTYTRDPNDPAKAIIYDMPQVGATVGIVAGWRH